MAANIHAKLYNQKNPFKTPLFKGVLKPMYTNAIRFNIAKLQYARRKKL